MNAKNLADLYHLPLVEWSAVEAQLNAGMTQAPGSGGPDRPYVLAGHHQP